LQPISQCMQVARKRAEATYGFFIVITWNRHIDFFRTDIHASCMHPHDRHTAITLLVLLSHVFLLISEETARGAKPSKLLIEIEASTATSSLICPQPRTHAYRRTSKSTNGDFGPELPLPPVLIFSQPRFLP